MKSVRSPFVKRPSKAPTGITGFDEGLSRGRTTLLVGGPGSGKTIFALQFLVQGAQDCKEPGISIALRRPRSASAQGEAVVRVREAFGAVVARCAEN